MATLPELPDDVLYEIFSCCDAITLRTLCRVCHRFRHLASQDFFWIAKGRKCLVTNQLSEVIRNRSCCLMSAKEKCRVALNWRREKYRMAWLLQQRTKYMPWLQMNSKEVWLSQGSKILAYEHRPSGRIGRHPLRVLEAKDEDICKFVVTDDLVFGSGSDGSIFGWSSLTGKQNFVVPAAHELTVNGLDAWGGDIVLSGSKDRTVKIWKISGHQLCERQSVFLNDRVWSIAANTTGDMFVCGTGGCYDHPLVLFCTETGRQISCLGDNYKYGAGVLHCLYESYHSLLTTGYDTYIRLWDTRASNSSSAIQWENPYDAAVYCLSSDQNVTFISGSAAHGLVWLWDKRSTRPIQMYYVGDSKSPVYSVAFDPCHMYVALDNSLCMLSFT